MSVFWLEKENLHSVVAGKLKEADIVLDIGCGIQPQHFLQPLVHVCCEPYEPYLTLLQQKVRNERDRNFVFLKATWAEAVRIFPPKAVDTIFLVDVIEHLDKEDARALLRSTERLAKRQLAIFTPLGFLPQKHPDGKDAWGLDGAEWQEHRSGWGPEDFDETWDIFAAKGFHAADNMGKEFAEPYGALWAIKTLPEEDPETSGGVRRQTSDAVRILTGVEDDERLARMLRIVLAAGEVHDPKALKSIGAIVDAASRAGSNRLLEIMAGISKYAVGFRHSGVGNFFYNFLRARRMRG